MKKYNRKYYRDNKDKINKYQRRYRLNNKEKINARERDKRRDKQIKLNQLDMPPNEYYLSHGVSPRRIDIYLKYHYDTYPPVFFLHHSFE